jgi:putative ABC transport system substrate-binding protein
MRDGGYVEGQNFAIETRWAEGRYDRLPALAIELAGLPVAVMIAGGIPPLMAAKAATSTIPIVFSSAADPVQLGLVASLNRPGGNVTGVSHFGVALAPKRLQLLLELVPAATVIGVLENPNNARPNSRLQNWMWSLAPSESKS